MKRYLCVCLALLLLFLLCACAPQAQNPTVIRTYEEGKEGEQHTWVTYYALSDGTWKTDTHTYQYCLELEGDFATITVLSNRDDITYSEAFMNLGFSSLSTDYFSPEEAQIACVVYNTKE